ncbi:MAG: universal stress protein, partial [Bacteroidetes bacterium QH_2_64_26]
HGRSGLERMLLGSVTERVVRRAPAPAFVVKSFGKSLLPASPETDP